MLSSRCLLLLLAPLFFTLNSQANDQLIFRYHKCNYNLGNFTDGSTYQNNLAAVLKNIYSDRKIDYGFYNFSYGQEPDKVNAVGFCRGDVNPTDCRVCLKSSAVLLTDRCQIQKEAIGYYDLCMLRYSNNSIFGVMDTDTRYVYNIENKTVVDDAFSQTLSGLLDELKIAAAEADWPKKFAEKSVKVIESNSNNDTIYGLVQCTPDLTKQICTNCLDSAYGDLSKWCKEMKGCLYLGPNCLVKYDTTSFYSNSIVNNTESPASQPSSQALPPKTAPANSIDTESPAPQPSQALSPKTTSTNSTNASTGLGRRKKLRTVIAIIVAVVVVFGMD